jgi:hypothetical protein
LCTREETGERIVEKTGKSKETTASKPVVAASLKRAASSRDRTIGEMNTKSGERGANEPSGE